MGEMSKKLLIILMTVSHHSHHFISNVAKILFLIGDIGYLKKVCRLLNTTYAIHRTHKFPPFLYSVKSEMAKRRNTLILGILEFF